jgi:predicted alpha/beta hydrolase
MITRENFETTCADGVVLRGIMLIPEKPRAIAQVNGGTAAKKEFYLPFAAFLAENGYATCVWDYRGSGDSAPAGMRHCTFTYSDYGTKDMGAIKSYMTTRFPQLPLVVVGHSTGGQQLGLMPDISDIKGLFAFAVSTGYAPYMPLADRIRSNYFFYIFSPISILLTGYVAAKRFGIMEDLPRNVVREWRDWCAKQDYFFNPKFLGKTIPEGHYNNYHFPVCVYWTTDDYISNKRSIPAFWNHIRSSAGIMLKRISPAEYKVKQIGHFGLFKKQFKETLWREALAKLDEYIAA